MLPFSLFLALKYLRPKRSFVSVVTVISIVGVMIGVAILIIVLSVMTGFDEMWRQKILSFKPHLTIVSHDGGVVENEDELCLMLDTVAGVTGAAPSIETRALMQFRGRTTAPVVVGVDPDRAKSVSRIPEKTAGQFNLDGNRAVVGVDLAQQLGLQVGDKILVYSPRNVIARDEYYLPEELTVTGIFNMGMRDFDSAFVLTSLEAARELVGLERGAHAIYVMTADPFRYAEFAQRVQARIGPNYAVRTWREVDSLLFEALQNEKAMMFVLMVFITVVALFCVTVTLIVITVQKTNEIGLLKALGFSSWKIMGAFVWLGWIQCLAGTAAGIGAGLLVLHNLQRIVAALTAVNVRAFPKEIYGLSEIPWCMLPWWEFALIAGIVLVLCTLLSLLPAWRAARLDPVEALRHE